MKEGQKTQKGKGISAGGLERDNNEIKIMKERQSDGDETGWIKERGRKRRGHGRRKGRGWDQQVGGGGFHFPPLLRGLNSAEPLAVSADAPLCPSVVVSPTARFFFIPLSIRPISSILDADPSRGSSFFFIKVEACGSKKTFGPSVVSICTKKSSWV